MVDLLTDEKLDDLADDLGTDNKLTKLGLKLGFPMTSVRMYMDRNRTNNNSEGTSHMLSDWKKATTTEKRIPNLVKALTESKLVALAEKFFPAEVKRQLEGQMESPSTSASNMDSASSMESKDRKDLNDILRKIAKSTKQNVDVGDLGDALGIPTCDIDSAKVGNRYGATHEGSLTMLQDWGRRQTTATAGQTIRDALLKLEWKELLEKCFPGYNIANVTESERRASPNKPGPSSDRRSDSSTLHGAEGQSSPSLTSNDEWKKSNVKRANPSTDDLDPEMKYVMWESVVKGNALIIGNADFPRKEQLEAAPRPWAEMDISNMKTLLRRLGYDFRNDRNIYRNLSKTEMLEAVQRFTEELNQDNPQSAVVYISSHGNEKGIEGKDRNILSIPDLLQKFSGVLLGKPKVLIIDACWGGRDTSRLPVSVRNDSTLAPHIICLPENADIFMIHSTSYGKVSWSNTENGSWFVNELCKVVYNNDRDLEDLDTIMLRVTKGIHTLEASEDGITSNGTQSTTVFKQGVDRKLFFFPGFSK